MSRLLPERTLAVHRKVSEDNLPDTLEIYKPSRTKGVGGMVAVAIGTRQAIYPCRMVLSSEAREVARADGLELDANWAIVVSLSANIIVGDRAVVHGKGWQREVEIIGTSNPRSLGTLRHVFAVDAKRA